MSSYLTITDRRTQYYDRLERYIWHYPNRWHQLRLWRKYRAALKEYSTMSDYEKLEYIHAALQENDEAMTAQALAFVEDLREPFFTERKQDNG